MELDHETRCLLRDNNKQELAERLLNSRKLLEAEKSIRKSLDEKVEEQAKEIKGLVHELSCEKGKVLAEELMKRKRK